MTTHTHLLFDLDGTVTDSGPGIMRSAAYALRAFGVPQTDEKALRRFVGPPLVDSFRQFYGMGDAEARAAVAKYREYYQRRGIFENAVYPGMAELLASLAREGRTLVLATSKPEVYARRILRHFGLLPYFDFVAGSYMDESRSDKAEVIAWALAQYPSLAPGRALMVGDRWYDIAGARRNGVDSVGVLFGYGTREELERAGAGRIAADVAELRSILAE